MLFNSLLYNDLAAHRYSHCKIVKISTLQPILSVYTDTRINFFKKKIDIFLKKILFFCLFKKKFYLCCDI